MGNDAALGLLRAKVGDAVAHLKRAIRSGQWTLVNEALEVLKGTAAKPASDRIEQAKKCIEAADLLQNLAGQFVPLTGVPTVDVALDGIREDAEKVIAAQRT